LVSKKTHPEPVTVQPSVGLPAPVRVQNPVLVPAIHLVKANWYKTKELVREEDFISRQLYSAIPMEIRVYITWLISGDERWSKFLKYTTKVYDLIKHDP